jgi:hypothetical protein
MLLPTLAVTHHVSAFWAAAYLIGLLVIEMFRRPEPGSPESGSRLLQLLLIGVVILGVLFPVVWASIKGNPLVEYLGPTIEQGLDGFYGKITGKSAPRQMFVSESGEAQPILVQFTSIAGTLLIAIGLATGFFRSLCWNVKTAGWPRLLLILQREWSDSRVILLALTAFGFPLSVALRLSSAGWQIGNRMSTFVFIGVAFVVAVGVVRFWQAPGKTPAQGEYTSRTGGAIARPIRWNRIGVNAALLLTLFGNVMLCTALPIHSPYRVGADADSIENMGIATAQWTKDWLGSGQRFASDRINRALLAVYGDQNVISSLQNINISRTIFSKKVTGDARYPIHLGKIDFLLVDLRLTTARAVLGEYYESWFEHPGGYPPSPDFMLKFDREANIGRIYDNGLIVIYDVSRLHD